MSLQPSQEALRERLAHVRSLLGTARADVRRWEIEQDLLLQQILPKKERCQACRGSGRTTGRDWQSGYEVESRCGQCNGTGYWEEPV